MYGGRNRARINSESFKKGVVQEVEEALAEEFYSAEKAVRDILDSTKDIVAITLGLTRSRWGGGDWEIDRTNGADRGHPLGIAYRDEAEKAAAAIVTEAVKDFTPTKGMLTAIQKEYSEQLGYRTREIAAAIASAHAREWAEAFVHETLATLDEPIEPRDTPAKEALKLVEDIAEGRIDPADKDAIIAAVSGVLAKEEEADG